MAKKCPKGFVCTDNSTLLLALVLIAVVVGSIWFFGSDKAQKMVDSVSAQPQIFVLQAPTPPQQQMQVRPDLYPEPVRRLGGGIPALASRGEAGPYQQIGIMAGEGGSSSSAAPDRTILPLYGREMDPRRGKWNYYTRTDGANPVQVPIRYRNRICDDDTNGCDEISNDDTVHVPALGRSFKASVYRKSMFN